MEKWGLARYLLDAKKCVDSIWFIDVCIDLIKHIDIRKRIGDCKRQFYINLRIVIDKSFQKDKKKNLKVSDSIVKDICERQKFPSQSKSTKNQVKS